MVKLSMYCNYCKALCNRYTVDMLVLINQNTLTIKKNLVRQVEKRRKYGIKSMRLRLILRY